MLKKITLFALIVILVGGFMAVESADAAEYQIRVGYQDRGNWPETIGDQPVADPQRAFGLVFEQYVESKTDGDIQVEHYPNSQLGSAKEMVQMVQSGTLDVCNVTGVMGPFFPEFQLIYMPYVFESSAVAHHFFDNSEFWADLMDQMEEEIGVKYLGMGQNGLRHFTSNTGLIKEPSDLEGVKIRVMDSPIYTKMMEAVGANPEPIAWNELYTALDTGVVDAQENPISVINRGSLDEVQKYLTLDAHTFSDNTILMNPDKFNSLPKEYQIIVEEAAKIATKVDRSNEALISRVTALDVIKDNFEEIYTPSMEEKQAFREKMQPPVVEWMKGEVGEEVVEDFLEAVEKSEEALGY